MFRLDSEMCTCEGLVAHMPRAVDMGMGQRSDMKSAGNGSGRRGIAMTRECTSNCIFVVGTRAGVGVEINRCVKAEA